MSVRFGDFCHSFPSLGRPCAPLWRRLSKPGTNYSSWMGCSSNRQCVPSLPSKGFLGSRAMKPLETKQPPATSTKAAALTPSWRICCQWCKTEGRASEDGAPRSQIIRLGKKAKWKIWWTYHPVLPPLVNRWQRDSQGAGSRLRRKGLNGWGPSGMLGALWLGLGRKPFTSPALRWCLERNPALFVGLLYQASSDKAVTNTNPTGALLCLTLGQGVAGKFTSLKTWPWWGGMNPGTISLGFTVL